MKVQIRDLAAFRGLNPHDIAAYLRTTGWREVETRPGHSSLWARKVDGEEVIAFLPLDRIYRDFDLRMAEVVGTIAAAEDRSQLEILSDLQEANADVIRVRLKQVDTADGTLALIDRGVPLLESASELLLAAACAAIEPRPRYPTRKPEQVNEFVRQLRLGQSERGSYVLKILSPVPPSLTAQSTRLREVEEPFARRAVQTLGRALQALRTASDQAMTSGESEPFEQAVRAGVSSNLCEAVVKMGGPVQPGDELVVSVTWARSRPPSPESVREVVIPSDRLPVIAEAARYFRAKARPEPVELRGAVIKLHRLNQQELPSNAVTILTFLDGRPQKVNVTLDDEDYRKAVQAHKRGATVTCSGDLVRQGAQLVLQIPREFTVSQDE
jgi:hypothetical protein